MDLNKINQKLREKFRHRRSTLSQNQDDRADSQPGHRQQLGNEEGPPKGDLHSSNAPGHLNQSSVSTLSATRSQPAPLSLPGGSSRELQLDQRARDTPIDELWNLAYENLRERDEDLIKEYEAKLNSNFTGALGSTLSSLLGPRVDRRDQMNTILQLKMQEINRDTWKLKFGSSEVQVKDLVQPVLGVVNWANEYVTAAVKTNPSASIAWGGVSLLLPLFLNPSKQAASLAKGVEYISSLIVQGRMWESLYIRRCEATISQTGQSTNSLLERIAFKEALEKLYQEILRFQIGSYCYYDTNAALRIGQDIIKWNQWDVMLGNIRNQEEKFASINTTWMDITYAEERSAADKRHRASISRWQTIGSDVSSLLEVVRDTQAESKREGLLDWLCSLDPSEAYNAARDKHMGGTSNWLIRDNKEFKAWEHSARSLLWLNGKPGCGKSILSSSVIRHLRDRCESDPRTALAYFFFSFSDPNKQKVDGMLASVLKQIHARRPDTPEPVQRLGEYRARGERPDTETLEAAVLATTHGFSETFVVIDALDECPTIMGERGKLLTSLCRIIAAMPDNLHILCTSRAEPDILAVMSTILSQPSRAEIDLTIYRDNVNRDVDLYIDKTFASATYSSWPNDLKEEAKKSLLRNADGMFQYIFCQFEALQSLSSEFLIRRELQRLPAGLDATYERLLLGLNRKFRTQITSVLKWLTSSTGPLKLEELAEIFVLRPESDVAFDKTYRLFEPSDFIKYMSSLIVVKKIVDEFNSNNDITYIHLAHFTVKEYLMSDRIAAGPAKCFFFTDIEANLHIAHSSLAYCLHCISRPKSDHTHLHLERYAFVNWMWHLDIVPYQQWPANVHNLAVQALAMHSKNLCETVGRDRFMVHNSSRLQMHWDWRTEALQRPQFYTALKGFTNVTDMLIGGGPNTNPYLTQEDMDIALHYAALGGCTAIVRLLVDKGADCNSDNGKIGGTLQAAAYMGHHEIVELLLNKGAKINATDREWGSALQAALLGDHFDVVQLLISRGSDINAPSSAAGCAMMSATPTGQRGYDENIECLRLLLDSGVDINMQCPTRGAALHYAAANIGKSRNSQCIRLLLDRSADVNLLGGKYGFPLHAICSGFKNPSDVKLLLNRGANVSPRGGMYDTVLQALFSNVAAEPHHIRDIAKLLLDRGADVNSYGGLYGSALQAACASSHSTENAQFLLNNGADVNAEGGKYGTALQAACSRENLQLARLLVDRGANLNALGGEMGSALQAAASTVFSGPELVQLLLRKGADVNALRGRFGTALQAACSRKNIDIVRILIDHGAEVNLKGGEYGTALQAACVRNSMHIVRILVDHGAKVNAVGGKYGTAIQAACYSSSDCEDPLIPQLLIEHGADIDQQGGMFGNAWHAAAAQEYTECALRWLLDHGIDVDDARGLRYATAIHAVIESDPKAWDPSLRIARIDFLLNHGADVNLGGGKYGFPLQSACSIKQEHGVSMTKHLLEKCSEIDVNAEGGHFGSALQAAVDSRQIESVRMLLDKGADINASGGIHRSALNAAIFNGHWDIVEVLLERGAIPDSKPDEMWIEDVRGRLGRGAVERYWKFWEKTGSQLHGPQIHREHGG